MPEIHEFAPHATYVPRKGEVNAWDNEDFVKTVKATGRKTLVMAGVWTGVCVMFPARVGLGRRFDSSEAHHKTPTNPGQIQTATV